MPSNPSKLQPSLLPVRLTLTAAALAATLISSGCATNALLESNSRVTSKTQQTVLSQDQIVAFGRPAQPLAQTPGGSLVIVGNKSSYVITQGGAEVTSLLTNLTPENIQVQNDMRFLVPNNDGLFQGTIKLSYAKLQDEFVRADYQFFLQNSGKECTTDSDRRITAQRFCFDIPISGAIYPQVSNLSMIQSQYKALSKPYTVTFYTSKTTNQTHHSGANSAQKLILLPFAIAFDVVTLPLQILEVGDVL